MYDRCFSTLGCPELSLDDVATLAARHRMTSVELRALGGTLELPEYFTRVYSAPDALAAAARAKRMTIPVIDTSFRLIGCTAAERDAFLAILPWAESLGARWLRVFDGGDEFSPAALADATATIAWWRQLRAERGLRVDLAVETHDVLINSERVLAFVDAQPRGAVSVLWDAHHTWKKGGEDPLVTWRAIQPHVTHIHVKDSRSIPQGKQAYTYVAPGTGEFPMSSLRAVLVSEYRGAISLEWEKWWHPDLSPLDDALTSATQHTWW